MQHDRRHRPAPETPGRGGPVRAPAGRRDTLPGVGRRPTSTALALLTAALALVAVGCGGGSGDAMLRSTSQPVGALAVAGADATVALAAAEPTTVPGSPTPAPPVLAASTAPVATTAPTPGVEPRPAAACDAGASRRRSETSAHGSSPPDPSGPPAASPDAQPPDTDPAPTVAMPVVPVVRFWSTADDISRKDLVAALTGRSRAWSDVIVPTAESAAIEDQLGIRIADGVRCGTADQVRAAVKRGALGLLRADDVDVSVRALGLDGVELFGNERIKRTERWPLTVPVATDGPAWDQAGLWTVVAGGDSMVDRGIYGDVVLRRKGTSYPFDGGTARVTGHYCCDWVYQANEVPRIATTGNAGAVRKLFKGADLAMLNHEAPIPDGSPYHRSGMVFGTHPRFLPLFTGAGIDFMSLANNHITDAGTQGIVDTLKNLDRVGIAYAGAGVNLKEAGKRTIVDVGGTKVAVVACVGVVPGTWAGPASAGGLPCKPSVTVPLVEAARERADTVIVFAHFGIEYQRQPTNEQRKLAAKWAAAGADLVLGAHPHVAGAIEQFGDTPVFYSLGNFIFDQNWSTPTMQALVTELTFAGGSVVQARVHPVIIGLSDLLQSQVNLLDPDTDDGKELMRTVRKISFVDW